MAKWSAARLLLPAAALSLPAAAVIQRLYPLGDVVRDADVIAVATVARRDARAHVVEVRHAADLKGKAGWSRTRFRLSGGDNRAQLPVLEKRLAPGRTVVLLGKPKRFMLGYVDGTWFRLAEPGDPKPEPWQFVHLELYLRRTYRGTSAELRRVVTDVLAGRAAAPAPDPTAKPGYGD